MAPKVPAPMTAPMASMIRSPARRLRFSPPEPSVSEINAAMGFRSKSCDITRNSNRWMEHRLTPWRPRPIGAGKLRQYKEEAFMAITLRPEHERAITQAIQSGAYHSPDEVIERALEVLRSEDQWLSRNT